MRVLSSVNQLMLMTARTWPGERLMSKHQTCSVCLLGRDCLDHPESIQQDIEALLKARIEELEEALKKYEDEEKERNRQAWLWR